jgi:hypothetical protein
MDDLTFILQEIKANASDPEAEFYLIFKDEECYFRMIRVCRDAYDESFKSRKKAFDFKYYTWIAAACEQAGVRYSYSKRQLADRHIRAKIEAELKNKSAAWWYEKAELPHSEKVTWWDWLTERIVAHEPTGKFPTVQRLKIKHVVLDSNN